MSLLSSLPKLVGISAKRRGRGYGSGRGAKSGRGTTRHQAARQTIRQDYEGGQNKLTKKFPLLRGKGRNKPIGNKPLVIRTDTLNILASKTKVTTAVLLAANIIDKKYRLSGVKIVAGGNLTVSLEVQVPVSAGAEKIIVKAGGTVTQNPT